MRTDGPLRGKEEGDTGLSTTLLDPSIADDVILKSRKKRKRDTNRLDN
jgi:hypothetical protein